MSTHAASDAVSLKDSLFSTQSLVVGASTMLKSKVNLRGNNQVGALEIQFFDDATPAT